MSSFFWGEADGLDKRHRIKWSNVCKPTQENGLGLCRLEDNVNAFGCKLWWKLRSTETLWARFIHSKYAIAKKVCHKSEVWWKKTCKY